MDKIEFRKEVLDSLIGTEDLRSYVKVMPLYLWLIPFGILLATAGFVYFHIETSFHIVDIFFGIEGG